MDPILRDIPLCSKFPLTHHYLQKGCVILMKKYDFHCEKNERIHRHAKRKNPQKGIKLLERNSTTRNKTQRIIRKEPRNRGLERNKESNMGPNITIRTLSNHKSTQQHIVLCEENPCKKNEQKTPFMKVMDPLISDFQCGTRDIIPTLSQISANQLYLTYPVSSILLLTYFPLFSPSPNFQSNIFQFYIFYILYFYSLFFSISFFQYIYFILLIYF